MHPRAGCYRGDAVHGGKIVVAPACGQEGTLARRSASFALCMLQYDLFKLVVTAHLSLEKRKAPTGPDGASPEVGTSETSWAVSAAAQRLRSG